MLKQWIEVEGHMFMKTLKVKTHRDIFFTNGPCVYFTVVMKFVSQFFGPPKLLKMPFKCERKQDFCNQLYLLLWNEVIQYSQINTMNCTQNWT